MALTWSTFGVGYKITSAKFTEIINNMNIERVRWGKDAYNISLPINTEIESSHIAILKDKIDDCKAVTWTKNTSVGAEITYLSVLELQQALDTIHNTCVCYCNYACTCRCNYTCTCRCNYVCTCRCNYACTCNCNYTGACPAHRYNFRACPSHLICTCHTHGASSSCISHTVPTSCSSNVTTICPSHNSTAVWS